VLAEPTTAKAVTVEPARSEERGPPLSNNYGLDRFRVMVRDTHWIFMYWELNGGASQQLTSAHAAEARTGLHWVLRVCNMRDMSSYMVDVDVGAGNWYLKVSPDMRLQVELGFANPRGLFVPVAKSDEVRTPPATVSASLEERWMSMPDIEDQDGRVSDVGAMAKRRSQRHALARLPVEKLRSAAPQGSSPARWAAPAEESRRVSVEQLAAIAPFASSPSPH
jgi:hypothetical protein